MSTHRQTRTRRVVPSPEAPTLSTPATYVPAADFGELRSVLQRPANPRTWMMLCDVVERMDAAELAERALPYLESYLQRWDDSLRVIPARWLPALFDGEVHPHMRIARTLDLRGRAIGSATFSLLGGLLDELGITRLGLSGVGLSEQAAADLAAQPFMSRVESLDLRGGLKPGALIQLMDSPHLGGLRRLDLSGNQALGPLDVHALARAPSVVALHDLRLNMVNASRERGLITALLHAPWAGTIETLALKRLSLDEQELRPLCMGSRLASLRRLDLSENPLGAQEVATLASSPLMRQLELLRLASTRFDDEAAEALVGAGDALASLRALHVNACPLRAAGAATLLRSPALEHLTELNLSRCRLDGEDELLTGAATQRLERLNLSHTHLRPRALTHMAAAEELPALTSLALDGVVVDLHAARALGSAAHWGALKEVSMAGSSLGSWGFTTLLRAPWMPQLERLDLQQNVISAALPDLATARSWRALRTLHLGDCALGDQGVEALAQAPFTRLADLSLNRNELTHRSVRALLAAPFAAHIEHLSLARNALGDTGLSLLAHTHALPQLVKLDLRMSLAPYYRSPVTARFNTPAMRGVEVLA